MISRLPRERERAHDFSYFHSDSNPRFCLAFLFYFLVSQVNLQLHFTVRTSNLLRFFCDRVAAAACITYSRSWISLASPFPRFLIWGCLWSDPNALDPGIPKRGSNQRHCLGWTVRNSSSHHYHHRVAPGGSNHDNPLLSVLPSSVSPTHPFKSDWLVSHPNNKKIINDSFYFDHRIFACEYGMEAFFVSKSHLFLFASFPWNPLDQCGELLLYFHVLLQRLLRPRDLHNLFPSSSTSTSTFPSSSSTLSLISRSISLPPVVGLKHKLSASERRGYPSALTGPPHQDQGNGVIIIRWQRTNSTSGTDWCF